MLSPEVERLSNIGFEFALRDRRARFAEDLHNLTIGLRYEKGVMGGPGVTLIINASKNEVRERAELALNKLKKTCESVGPRYYDRLASDLAEVLRKITTDKMKDILSVGRGEVKLLSNDPAQLERFESQALSDVRDIGPGIIELEHYAHSMRCAQEKGRRSFWGSVALLAIGAVFGSAVTITTDWAKSMFEHRVTTTSSVVGMPTGTPTPVRRDIEKHVRAQKH